MSLAERQRETVARLLSGRVGPGEAVHAANIRATLTQTLRTSFPVTEALVGQGCFRALALEFLATQPPVRPVLAQYGAAVPAFLADYGLVAALPYLADLARLEWARQCAFFAADSVPLTAGDLASQDAAARLASRLAPRPGVTVLRSAFPVFSIWAAHQPDGPDLETVDPAGPGECGAVYRDDGAVRHRQLDSAALALLAALDRRTALGEVLEGLRGSFDDAALGAALAVLLGEGLLAS